ncbi:MAG: hypothetical protein ABH950_07800 [Candidatus Altiarchaeota archaeon]
MAPDGDNKNIWGFINQAEDLKEGIQSILDRSQRENIDIIIEGIHLIPGIFDLYCSRECLHVVINVSSFDQHMSQFQSQGDIRGKYKIDHIKRARAFQDYLVENAEKNGAIIVENQKVDVAVNEIIRSLDRLNE